MKEVKVLAKDGQELMPTTIEKANKLISKGEAEIVETSPMTIRILKNTKRYKQETLGDSYDLPITYEEKIPIGVTYINEEVDLYWSLKKYSEEHWNVVYSNTVLVADDDLNPSFFIHNTIASLNYTPNISMIYTSKLNGSKYAFARNVRGSAGNDVSIADTSERVKRLMMDRFKLLEQHQVNRIELLNGTVLTNYKMFNREWNWDALFTVVDNTDAPEKAFGKMGTVWHNRNYYTITIKEMYEKLNNGEIKYFTLATPVKGVPRHIFKFDIEKTEGEYAPHKVILIIDDLDEIMLCDNYKAVHTVKDSLSAIARLGRAAGVYLILKCQRASGSTVSTDLLNNCLIKIRTGNSYVGQDIFMFDKELPPLKDNRAYVQFYGREVYEIQSYNPHNIEPWDDVFDITKTSIAEIQANTGYAKDFDLTVKPSKELLDKIEESKKEYAKFVEETEYVYLSKGEVKDRLLKKINSLEKEISSIKEDIDMLFSELDNIIE